MPSRLVLKVHGRVQGVGFRQASCREAIALGLKGYVKNCSDGSVDVVLEGSVEGLKNFRNWCYNSVGPAMVQRIEQAWSESTSEFSDFVIRF